MPKFEKKKDFITRESQESAEGQKTIDTQVPDSRYQTKQQVSSAVDAEKTKMTNTGFEKKKVESSGSVLKQEVAARVVDNGIGGEISATSAGLRSLAYSGNAGMVLESSAYTPIAGHSRSKDAVGKKLDVVAKAFNYIPNEQVEEEFTESKPLAESEDKVQYYNGTPKNIHARMQKNTGAVPADILFQRSIDEVKRDQLYFTTGQVVYKSGDNAAMDTPNFVPTVDANGVYSYGKTPNYTLNRSNYLHRTMTIRFNAAGKLTKMVFGAIDAHTVIDDDTIQNDASANRKIDMNAAEMDRQIMDHKAGDEKADIWTPLARANKTPTLTVGYLRDIENITGAEVFTAYKKVNAALAYYHNRTAKDGIKLVAPFAEFVLGLKAPEDTSIRWSNMTTADIFDVDQYKDGASSLFIAIQDSIAKYNNKADILTQPRSFKLAVQTADNNMNPLRVKADFVKNINAREVFSTIDREYDPLSPVCISDRVGLIHCYNFNDLYSFDHLDAYGEPVFTKNPYSYMYSDLRNNYVVTAEIPLLAGLHDYLNSIGPKIVSLEKGALVDQDITISMVHSTCFMSLWSLFVLAATPFILQRRINSMRDVLYYEKNVEYPFHQLITLKDANPLNAVNYDCEGMNAPLVCKKMSPSAALTWVLPEVFWPVCEHNTPAGYSYVLPWYFNQNDYEFTGTSIARKYGKYNMSFPSVRSGVRFGYLDDIYGMSERDVRLNLDRLVEIPTTLTEAGSCGVYKYSQNCDGIPMVTITSDNFTIKTWISLARELGWFMVAPAGLLSKMKLGADTWDYGAAELPIDGQSSYKVKYWHGRLGNAGASTDTILAKTNINVSRASAYRQDWNCIHATQRFGNDDADWGFALSLNDVLSVNGLTDNEFKVTLIDQKSSFIPFTNGTPTATNDGEGLLTNNKYRLMSLQKALWTRVQKLPFAISPFDMRINKAAGVDDCLKADPFDFLYYFGLAGFKASDYEQDVYNRSIQILNQGFNFLEDPFYKDSPLTKESGTYTQSANTEALSK